MTKPKILLVDVETAPLLVHSWELWQPRLTHENIVRDTSLICVAAKWLGKRVYCLSVDPKTPTDDRELCKSIYPVLQEADVLVGHNLERFDRRVLNARFLFHGMKPLPPVQVVDTLKIARKHFRLTSNRLDYLGRYLNVGRKLKTDFGLWLKVLAGDSSALDRMKKYCSKDVDLLHDVYLKLRAFDERHPNVALMSGKRCCPNCGGGSLESRGLRYAKSCAYRRLICRNCGAPSRETKAVTTVGVVPA